MQMLLKRQKRAHTASLDYSVCVFTVPEGLVSAWVRAKRGRRSINLLSSRGCTGGQNLRMIWTSVQMKKMMQVFIFHVDYISFECCI